MDTEEREELKQNDLMNWFQYGLPIFLKKNGSYILLVFALGLLGWELWGMYQKKQAVQIQEAWNKLAEASAPNVDGAPAQLLNIINQYEVKPVQALAWLRMGNIYLETVAMGNPAEGYNGVKGTKEDAIKRAEDAYNHVLNEFGDQTLVAGSAHMGLAAAAEDRGDFDGAKKQYEILTDKGGAFGDTAFGNVAQAKLNHLDDLRKAPPLDAMVPVAVPTTIPSSTEPLKDLMGPLAPTGPAMVPAMVPATVPATMRAK